MAERRMFAKTIIDSDAFLDMPQSSQLLYFHLSMRADDEGFINNPKSIMRNVGCKDDDMKLLIAKKFIIPFESGIVVIKHWKIHNYIAKDRFTPTKYQEERSRLELDENKSYTQCIQPVYELDTQVRIGKDSIGKDSIEEDREDKDIKETYVSLIESYTTDPQLISILKQYVEMRKKMKGFTTHALKLNLNTLSKLATIDSTKVAIVEQSIEHSWKSFYELKLQPRKEVMPEWTKEETVEKPKADEADRLKLLYKIYKSDLKVEEMRTVQEQYFELTGKEIEGEI